MTVRIICSALLIAVFLLYPWLNKRAANAHIIKLWIDDWIPLVPIFSIPYILYIPFLAITLGYFVFFTELYQAITISFIFCIGIASIIYFFYQTTVPRPEITGIDFSSQLLRYIYSKDQPYNCFPSLHTALSVLSFLYWIQVFPSVKWSMGAFVLSIIFSTMALKQHYIPDAISGLILALASFYVSTLIFGSRMF